ncbi:PPOX class F420-dependent oxidoreductase [Saccharomonospora sp. NPDC046836]|uniref:PPOX class F420-dependent oxidoreductase n=1 Tax=Saccharomonospora sp. NPDC046836 TaxID=3156921 RepID=UPI0033F494D6
MAAQQRVTRVLTAVAGLAMLAAGIWALAAPGSFAAVAGLDPHSVGAFQIGLGLGLLLALAWADALAAVLTAFGVALLIQTVDYAIALDAGGSAGWALAPAALTVTVAVALAVHLRGVGYMVGTVTAATVPELAPFVRQKTVSLTTYRKDGRPGRSPVSIAVDGDHAYIRSFEKSLKTRRLRRDPRVVVTPSTGLGTPTGPGTPAKMRLLDGAEYRHAARMLRRKHPFLHGVLVPLVHRLARAKTGRTVHFELTLT